MRWFAIDKTWCCASCPCFLGVATAKPVLQVDLLCIFMPFLRQASWGVIWSCSLLNPNLLFYKLSHQVDHGQLRCLCSKTDMHKLVCFVILINLISKTSNCFYDCWRCFESTKLPVPCKHHSHLQPLCFVMLWWYDTLSPCFQVRVSWPQTILHLCFEPRDRETRLAVIWRDHDREAHGCGLHTHSSVANLPMTLTLYLSWNELRSDPESQRCCL